MKYIDEFRDKKTSEALAREISKISSHTQMTIMEVCGTHTMSIYRYGIKDLLPPSVHLLSGPGCPVCVTPNSGIDRAIGLARKEDVILTTFGDMLKVPGSSSSLEKEKAQGCDIRIVYSPMDGVEIAEKNLDKKVIFMGIGFETTAPVVAATVREVKARDLKNFFVLSLHKIIPPAIQAILDCREVRIDGFLLPGHVSTITGLRVYDFIVTHYDQACVVSGFEPLDILQSVLMLASQITSGKKSVENQYTRMVKPEGNIQAKRVVDEVFQEVDSDWRGLGTIPMSGLRLRKEYSRFDAFSIDVEVEPVRENKDCLCGMILRGVKRPHDCTLFGKECTPEEPQGPCMVSSEGTCAAHYKYGSVNSDS
jgi:hydrogenase expression/formation protein HypD